MTVLEREIAELNAPLIAEAQRYASLLGEYFDAAGDALAEVRSYGLLAIGDRLHVPPALLPKSVEQRLHRLHIAFRMALDEVFDGRMGGQWGRLADELRLDDATRRYLDFGRRPRWATIARPEVVISGDTLTMAEPNAGSSCGAMPGTDVLGRLFESSPIIGDYLRAVGAKRTDSMPAMAGLIRARLAASGHPADALVAVTELRAEFAKPGYRHCHTFAAELRRHGVRAVAAPVEELDCGGGAVTLHSERCALVYRKWGEQPDPAGQYPMLEPVMRAARAGQVVLLDDLGDQIAVNKTVLAVLSEELDAGALSAAVSGTLTGFVPWTRLAVDGPATWRGEKIDLMPWALGHQHDLVVKPGSGYQGRGVTIGCEVPEAEWTAALDHALGSDEPWLVQELRRSSPARISVSRGGKLTGAATYVNYGYFAIGDVVPAGVLRGSAPFGTPRRKINLGSGGHSPVFFV